jgi:hypothetical protein
MGKGYISFGEIAAKLPMLRVECSRCGRRGRYRTDKLIERYGADSSIEPWQQDLVRDCPRNGDPLIELGKGCAPLCPELSTIA